MHVVLSTVLAFAILPLVVLSTTPPPSNTSCVFDDTTGRSVSLSSLSGVVLKSPSSSGFFDYKLIACGTVPADFCPSTSQFGPSMMCQSASGVSLSIASVTDSPQVTINTNIPSLQLAYHSGDASGGAVRTAIITYTCDCQANITTIIKVTESPNLQYNTQYTSRGICPAFGIDCNTARANSVGDSNLPTISMKSSTGLRTMIVGVVGFVLPLLLSFFQY